MKRAYKPKTQRGTDARQSAQKRNWRLFKIAGACANLKTICSELGLPSINLQVLTIERRLRDETKSQYELSK